MNVVKFLVIVTIFTPFGRGTRGEGETGRRGEGETGRRATVIGH